MGLFAALRAIFSKSSSWQQNAMFSVASPSLWKSACPNSYVVSTWSRIIPSTSSWDMPRRRKDEVLSSNFECEFSSSKYPGKYGDEKLCDEKSGTHEGSVIVPGRRTAQ